MYNSIYIHIGFTKHLFDKAPGTMGFSVYENIVIQHHTYKH